MKLTSVVYDAGTEKNTESVGTIPGPADGGRSYPYTHGHLCRADGLEKRNPRD